jgi:iron complex outermembrane receptor protein
MTYCTKSSQTFRIRRAALLCAVASAVAPALACAAPVPAPADGTIAEITVTAQKRTESAQKVPISIQSFDASHLKELGVSKLQDIEMAAPSLSFGDGSEQGRTGIRGVVDYSRNAGYDSRVGLYVDGVYYSRSWMTNQTLLGTQQIDVLRGPQGTLFGKNTDAGAIAITTRQPGFTPNGEFEAEYGTYEHWEVAGRINLPLNDKIALQISATHLQEQGYYHNTELGERNEGINSNAVRAQLLIKPSDTLKLTISGDYIADENSTVHYTAVPAPGSNPYYFKSYWNDSARRRMGGGSLTADLDLGNSYQLSSITAYRAGTQALWFNNEASTIPYLTAYLSPSTDQFSEELRLVSPKYAHWDFVAGAYYFWSQNRDHEINYWGSAMVNLGPVYGQYAGSQSTLSTSVSTYSTAAYAQANIHINDVIEVFAGGRETYEIKDLNNITNVDPFNLISASFSGYHDEQRHTFFTPKGGVNIHAAPGVLLFGTIGRGFKSGGWNVEGTSAAQLAAGLKFRPEYVTSFEAGLKSDWFNHHARFNVTGFYEKFTDFQVFTFVATTVAGRTVTTTSLNNAGKVSSKGVEIEAAVLPFEGLSLSGNYTYDISKFDSYPGGGGTYMGAVLNANGVQTPYAPKGKAYLALDYTHAVGNGLKASGHFGVSAQASENFDPKVVNPLYTKAYFIPGYTLADARIGLSSEAARWSLSIWSKNLFDKSYVKFANRTALLGSPAVLYGQPRTIGVTLGYKY